MYVPSPITPHPFPREPKFQSAVKWMLFICVLAIIASYCSGCSKYTPQKAAEQIYKANAHYPDTTAAITRSLYPCTTTQVDTFINWIDTVINVDCPDTAKVIHDTISGIKVTTKTVRVPVQVQLPGKTIIQKVEDSAKIRVMAGEITRRDVKISDHQQRIEGLQEALNKARKTRNWLWLIVAGLVLFTTRKIWLPVIGRMANPLP